MKKQLIGITLLALALLSSQCQKTMSQANSNKMQEQPTTKSDTDPFNLPVEAKVSGEYMKAFLVAYEAFRADSLIPEEKRRIENYGIEFRQHGDVYFVLFFAKRNPDERELEGGESKLGKDVMYKINKKDNRIIERLFYK